MKNTILFLFLISSLITYSQNSGKNFLDQNYIEVIGKAELEVIPNMIYLHIIISEKDKMGRESVEKQEEQMLKEFDLIDESISNNLSIISFSSTYIRYFFKKNDVKKVKQYELLLTDVKNLAPVFAILDTLDVSNVSIVKLDHSDMDNLKQETKIKSIVAAKDKAELYTKAIKQKTGKALFIQELNAMVTENSSIEANVLNESRDVSSYSKSYTSSLKPIELSKIYISASVLTRFALH